VLSSEVEGGGGSRQGVKQLGAQRATSGQGFGRSAEKAPFRPAAHLPRRVEPPVLRHRRRRAHRRDERARRGRAARGCLQGVACADVAVRGEAADRVDRPRGTAGCVCGRGIWGAVRQAAAVAPNKGGAGSARTGSAPNTAAALGSPVPIAAVSATREWPRSSEPASNPCASSVLTVASPSVKRRWEKKNTATSSAWGRGEAARH
jgi:hypothetical protein